MSSSYSSFERLVARILSVTPRLKKIVKRLYQYINWFAHRSRERYYSKYPVLSVYSTSNFESFFGYYDKSPLNSSGTHILVHLTPCSTKDKPDPSLSIRVVLMDFIEKKEILSLESRAYNWQQGTRAHWLTDDLFIFNDFDQEKGMYISRVFSISKRQEEKHFFWPVQDSFQNIYFLSINYRRLLTLRPDYGYRNLSPLSRSELAKLHDDGVWRINYQDGQSRLLFSLSRVCEIKEKPEFVKALHKINHVMVSPAGDKFVFLHRYYIGERRFDRLMIADSNGVNIQVLSDFGMVSHYFWIDNQNVLGYLSGPEGGDGYYIINVSTGNFNKLVVGQLRLYGDGHPHVCGDWFITDTYPDKARMQCLILVNWKTGEIIELGKYFHSFGFYDETRCDLHPRLSFDGKIVFFDSVYSGKRELYYMSIM